MVAVVYEIINKRHWYTSMQEMIRNLGVQPYLYVQLITYRDALKTLRTMSDRVDTVDGFIGCGFDLAPEVKDMYVEYHNEYDRLRSAIETYKYEMKVK